MRMMMLMALFVSLGAGHSTDVAPGNSMPASQMGFSEIPTVRLLIRGGTAQWGFQFACAGAHCRFRHTHVLHHFGQAQYVNLAVRFSGFGNSQSDAAMWLRRVSATRESAERN